MKKNIITYGKQYLDSKDYKLVMQAMKSPLLTNGKYVKLYEKKVSKTLNSKYAISCNNGTSALYLILKALNLKPGEIIIMPSVNFIASYNMALALKLKIILCDVDRFTGQITPDSLLKCLTENKIKNFSALILMYHGGHPENIQNFYKMKKKLNFYIIEDACHALGAANIIKNKKHFVGSCKFSDAAAFSTHPLKTITTGEGGIVTTNKKQIYKSILKHRSHGFELKNNKFYWKYQINDYGFNFRLSDLNCALGYSQLGKINFFLKRRKNIAQRYIKKILSIKFFNEIIHLPKYCEANISSWHLFLIHINFKKLKISRDQLIQYLNRKGIFCQIHYTPIYKFRIYKTKIKNRMQNSENYFNSVLSLPIYPQLDISQQDYVIHTLKNYLNKKLKKKYV